MVKNFHPFRFLLIIGLQVAIYFSLSLFGDSFYPEVEQEFPTGRPRSRHVHPKTESNHFTVRFYYPYKTEIPSWIQSYVDFHNAHVSFDDDTQTAQLKAGAKYIMYTCTSGCGGVGDRIKGMLTLFYFALMTNRVLLIDHPYPIPLTETLKPNHIIWNVPKEQLPPPEHTITALDSYDSLLANPCALNDVTGIHVLVNLWYGDIYRKSNCMRQFLIAQNVTQSFTNDFYHMMRWSFWTLFRFNDQVIDRADDLRRQAGLPFIESHVDRNQTNFVKSISTYVISNRSGNNIQQSGVSFNPYIGMHIRGERHVGKENSKKFLDCAKQLRKQLDDEYPGPTRLTFVTDDSYPGNRWQSKKILQSLDPESVRIADVNVVHIDELPTEDEGHLKSAIIDIYAEMVILLDSECLIRSRSGFSELVHQIAISNTHSFTKCGLQFDQCNSTNIKQATHQLPYSENY